MFFFHLISEILAPHLRAKSLELIGFVINWHYTIALVIWTSILHKIHPTVLDQTKPQVLVWFISIFNFKLWARVVILDNKLIQFRIRLRTTQTNPCPFWARHQHKPIHVLPYWLVHSKIGNKNVVPSPEETLRCNVNKLIDLKHFNCLIIQLHMHSNRF